ncbi:MAG: PD-(D/E)XK nuclease family protein [Arcobacteraceae bacterium]|nr:PD-(D/E)XK nuclease family protein [Arcobacteraceae bacterium]
MLSKNLLIFPASRAIREYIEILKSQNQLLPKSITIGDFFSRAVLTNNKTIIDKDLRILYLKEAIGNIDIKKLGLTLNFSKFYNQSEYIFKFFNELNSEFKTIDDLESSDTYSLYIDHLDILRAIYKQYLIILDKNNFIDNITLPLNYSINETYINDFEDITLFYEGYFSSFEFQIINEVSQITTLYIDITINDFNQKNIEIFKKIGIDLDVNNKYRLDISNKKIIKQTPLKQKVLNHTIYPIAQRITQVAFIKSAIVDMVNEGIEASKIIVLLPDESFHTYLKLFDYEKYFNFAMGNDIKNSITLKRANSIERYLQNKEPKDEKKIEFFNLDKKYVDDIIKVNWNKKVDKKLFFDILDFIIIEEKNEEILSQIVEIKLSLENLLFSSHINAIITDEFLLKDAYKILLVKLQEIVLDDVYGGVVTVLGILETRYVQYDGVIVVDFNDDKIPKRSIKDKFISTQVKKIASLPTLQDRQDLQKYYYKRLFDGAKKIAISYVEDDQNTISRFSKQIFKNANIVEKDFSAILQNNRTHIFQHQEIVMSIDLSLREWSSTSLKTFLECKRKYYLHYIQNIKEHNISLKPAGYEVGQIIHNILEKLYKEGTFSYINLTNEISKYQGKNPYLTLDLEIWKKRLNKFCQNDIKRLNSGINIVELEKPFKLQYKDITIKGTIDRIDRLEDGTYSILDYKTSSSLKIDTAKTFENSIDFQLEFYYLALRDRMVSEVGYYDLNDGSIKNEIMLEEKIKRVDEIFLSLKTKEVDFKKCEDKKSCLYCDYKVICDRG